MANGINKVILIGNLGKDPDLRYTPNGTAVASFSLATNERWKDKEGNYQDRTEWHRIVAWSKLAETVGEYLKKGSQVFIEGKIRSRTWEDQNGVKRTTTEIVANNLVMLGRREGVSSTDMAEPAAPSGDEMTSTDDLPF
ncbi:single-stranded DNA-binding protein [bacterium BMS3Bbin03]|nr:single-stranded DNA-binding protein [bacterium BMS3Bbin03]